MTINDILQKYNIIFKQDNKHYYIKDEPYMIIKAQEVNNEPNNLRIQTGNKDVKSIINSFVNNYTIKPKLWAIQDVGEKCYVAEFYDALDDFNLLEGNKSLKFKKTDFGDVGSVNQSTMRYQAKLFYLYNEIEKIEDSSEIDIQPESDIYSFFKNLSYKTWYALSEFVDNSTGSFFDKKHQIELNDDLLFSNLEIKINYNKLEMELIIEDNAYGMELTDFKRAFRLKAVPLDKSGRNEFGMGLKTAAFWFGKKLTVISTEYGSPNEYSLTLDTTVLDEQKLKKLNIKKRVVPKLKHGTTVIIGDVYPERDISNGITQNRIYKELSTIYRRDLLGLNSIDKEKKVRIFLNGKEILPEDKKYSDIFLKMHQYYSDFLLKNPQFQYKIDLNIISSFSKKFKFSVEHKGIFYHVKCEIGFLNNTGSSNAGFVLYRRGRVIEGSVGKFLKPNIIFGAPNSFESQRLFAEIDLDDILVAQAKDSFLWSDELQEKVYYEIKLRSEDIIYVINKFRKEDKLPEGYEIENSNPTKIVQNIIENQSVQTTKELKLIDEKSFKNRLDLIKAEHPYFNDNEIEKELFSKRAFKASSVIYFFDGVKYKIQFVNIGEFIKVLRTDNETFDYLVEINITHDFFAKFSNNEEFIQIVTEFALAIVAAEIHFEGDFDVDRYRTFINRFISNRGDKK